MKKFAEQLVQQARQLESDAHTLVEEVCGCEEVGENGEHNCLDGDGVGNVNDEGVCVVCGATDLL